MKLERLKIVKEECRFSLQEHCSALTTYYWYDGHWRDLDTQQPVDAATATALQKSKGEAVAYHAPSSKTTWFYAPDLSAGFSVSLTQSPRLSTREIFRARLDAAIRNGLNAYKVAYSQLTGLLARDAFKQHLCKRIEAFQPSSSTQGSSVSEEAQTNAILLLAFDLDKFKQINDTFGHLYGDQVLRAFALRLERSLKQLTASHADLRIDLAHPSGEEFCALIEGPISSERARLLAESFRSGIASQELPSDDEWQALSEQHDISAISKPFARERVVTASIGAAFFTPSPSPTNPERLAMMLIDNADTALMKAKAAGRNRVVHFADILFECGRVIECHSDLDVLVVDIGTDVGIQLGQELLVYHPKFSGGIPLTIDDGRSTRILGTYPRLEVSRAVVFDAQREISFARTTSDLLHRPIPIGAHVKAVALGSISHLLSSASQWPRRPNEEVDLSDPSKLEAAVESHISNKNVPFIAVFRFWGDTELLRRNGSAAINQRLAELFEEVKEHFHDSAMIGIIDRMSICVVGDSSKLERDALKLFCRKKFGADEDLAIMCGIAIPGDSGMPSDEMAMRKAIDAARYAASDNAQGNSPGLRFFGGATAAAIMASLRSNRLIEQALADYARFKAMGIQHGSVENLAGLCYATLNKLDERVACYERAVQLSPDSIIFRGNLSIALAALLDTQRSIETLSGLSSAQLEELKKDHPLGYRTYATQLAMAKIRGLPSFNATHFNEIAPTALSMLAEDQAQMKGPIEQALGMG